MNCDICEKSFTKEERKPISLTCGHSICQVCLDNWKKSKQTCPTCRQLIIHETPNYYLIGLLDKNLINEAKIVFNEIQDIKKRFHSKSNLKMDEIQSMVDSIKSFVNYRAAELTAKVKLRQDHLIEETDRVKEFLNKRISSILQESVMNCDIQMDIKELENIKFRLIETEDMLNFDLCELRKIESLIEYTLVEKKEDEEINNSLGDVNSLMQSYLNQANFYFRINQYFKAIECLDKSIEINDDFEEVHFLKGRCLERLNKNDLAIQCYDKAIQRSNHIGAHNCEGFLQKNDHLNSYFFQIALSLNKNPVSSQDFYNKGDSLLGLKKYRDAIECYNKAIELNPVLQEAYSNKAVCLKNILQYRDAIDCVDKSIELNPLDPVAFYHKGNIFKNMEKYRESIECYNKSINLNPYSADSFNNRGVSFKMLAKYNNAIESYNKAIELNSKHPTALFNKARSLENLGKYEDAIVCYNKHIDLNQNDAAAFYNKGICLNLIGSNQEAIGCLDKAIRINPNYSEAINKRNMTLLLLKN